MRIALETRAANRKSGGTKTYTEKLLRALRGLNTEHEYIPLPSNVTYAWQLPWWLQVTLPRAIAREQVDVVHFTKSVVPSRLSVPTVVTIYDIIPILFPESQQFLPRLLWPEMLRQAAQRSNHVITISEASRRDIIREFNLDPSKVTATPLAVDRATFKPATDKPEKTKPMLLWVGTIEPRKNVPLLVRAFARIAKDVPHNLVLAGGAYRGLDEVKKTISEHGLGDRVEIRGRVSEAELQQLYQQAELFVWPSIYEGWGFPPQEAMASGTPVVVGNGGSLPEVVGEAGVVVPFSEDLSISERTQDQQFELYLAQAIESLLATVERRRELSEAGLNRVKNFTWTKVAEQTNTVYQLVA